MALVTGASSGIGQAIVAHLLDEGWQVTGLSRSAINRADTGWQSHQIDISDSAALQALLDKLPVPQAVIHAAGMMQAAPLGELDLNISTRLWQLHVATAEQLANHFAPRMSAGGRIVLLGSRTSGGASGRSQYVATKSAMIGMVRSWAAELAPRGITANIVAPGATETPMLKQPDRASSPPRLPPIGRYIQPQEVAGLVNFLLSPAAAAITGQQLVMCGGASLS
ncbi:SDR family NAD(P)-dependent oxidoreductase [Pantoea vagans]|uniref:SDR family NAD(P)-dependent oxidoreductase n=1 Tax=Pantoea vagans TaxID=470934 RepID=UPI0023AFC007|nr:SDR family oxidoreductase [Pantoea vagans]MDE8556536.1 SDR family oxidoreductase [Pantoea vagans]MDE8576587.1 SDR family oxidoreductase [Pantoea vagans]